MADSARNRRSYRWKNRWRTVVRQAVLAKTGGVCAVVGCGWAGVDGKGKGMILAHIVPADPGRPEMDDVFNLQPMCPRHHRLWDADRRGRRR